MVAIMSDVSTAEVAPPEPSPEPQLDAPKPTGATTQEFRIKTESWLDAINWKMWAGMGTALATLIGTCSNGTNLEKRHDELVQKVEQNRGTSEAKIESLRVDIADSKKEQKADIHALYRAVLERRPQERLEIDGGTEK